MSSSGPGAPGSPGTAPAPGGHDVAALERALGDVEVLTAEAERRRRSRDFYWYSPVLKRRLENVIADAIVMPRDEAQVLATLRECFARRIPVTARSGGTGNYGQAMPVAGGVVLDLSRLTSIEWIRPGSIRCGAGLRLQRLEKATIEDSGQELRFYPSTRKLATIGGFIAGGSAGVGSINWGGLSDPGNVLGARVLTLEAQPRTLELRGPDLHRIMHAYGTNGILTEIEMPLAPACEWRDYVVGMGRLADALAYARDLAGAPGISKKLVSVIAAPIAQDYFKPLAPMLEPDEHVVMTMIAPHSDEAFRHLTREAGGRIAFDRECADGYMPPIYEFTWNHTTLHALKVDPSITYLQTGFASPDPLGQVMRMVERFGDEVPMHVEFVYRGGAIVPVGLQLVRFTTEARLSGIIAEHEAHGVQVFSPHAYTIEGGGSRVVDPVQLQFKREADPLGLLNPGKMIGWENPDYDARTAPCAW